MRIALVSTPFLPVPPPAYGGTELVVGELALALRARGHEVVVYATGDSYLPGIEIRHYFVNSQWPPDPAVDAMHGAFCVRDILRDPRGFDAVHLHDIGAVPVARHLDCPVIYTLHHDVDAQLSARYLATPRLRVVAISHAQARCEIAPVEAVVHHGLDPARFAVADDQGYLLFLGRYDRCKGPDLALEVAERAGLPLVMAGAPHDLEYWKELKPRLARSNALEVGPVGGRSKAALIARARAVLFPIRWDEPFGLVMIEAMLSGVPVIGLARGSVSEVIENGVTGVCCASVSEMVGAARGAEAMFDRSRVRAAAQQRWSASRMADEYLSLYRAVAPGAARGVVRAVATATVGDDTAANS
jgi:glycosyltransferase involved in cell wall biosynthesis